MFDIRGEDLIDILFKGFDTNGVGCVLCVVRDDAFVFCVQEFDYPVDEIA
jgi:hypothetical protein